MARSCHHDDDDDVVLEFVNSFLIGTHTLPPLPACRGRASSVVFVASARARSRRKGATRACNGDESVLKEFSSSQHGHLAAGAGVFFLHDNYCARTRVKSETGVVKKKKKN